MKKRVSIFMFSKQDWPLTGKAVLLAAALFAVTGCSPYFPDTDTDTVSTYSGRRVSWTDAAGQRHDRIPDDKTQWYTGEVLEYQRATKGAGIDIVLVNDAFNKKEMEVGGVWETTAADIAELFFKMPVIRDYREYFNIYILMRVSPKSGLFRLYDYQYRGIIEEDIFADAITAMPQIGPGKGDTASVIPVYNGFAGGFMIKLSYSYAVYQFCTSESNFPAWMMHEFMGHGFCGFRDQYFDYLDITQWWFLDESMGWQPSVTPVTKAPKWREHDNSRRVKWDDAGWQQFISIPGNAKYAANEMKYKQLSVDGEGKPVWIWQNRTADNFMRNHDTLQTDAWDRFLVYKRIKELAGEAYSVVDFLGNDQQYINMPSAGKDWYDELGVAGWHHTYPVHDPDNPDTYAAWDDE